MSETIVIKIGGEVIGSGEAALLDVIDATGFERRDDEPPRGRSLPS